MDFTLLSSIVTVVSLLVFVGIMMWAFSRHNKERFEELVPWLFRISVFTGSAKEPAETLSQRYEEYGNVLQWSENAQYKVEELITMLANSSPLTHRTSSHS